MGHPNWQTVLIATIVVVISLVSPAIVSPRPGPLIGTVAATIVSLFMGNIDRVGEVSLELPTFGLKGQLLWRWSRRCSYPH